MSEAEFIGDNWYCAMCGCEFSACPFEHETAECPDCGRILKRSGGYADQRTREQRHEEGCYNLVRLHKDDVVEVIWCMHLGSEHEIDHDQARQIVELEDRVAELNENPQEKADAEDIPDFEHLEYKIDRAVDLAEGASERLDEIEPELEQVKEDVGNLQNNDADLERFLEHMEAFFVPPKVKQQPEPVQAQNRSGQ